MNKLGSLEGCLWTANPAIRVRTPGEGAGNDPDFLRHFFFLKVRKKIEFSMFKYIFFSYEIVYNCLLFISKGFLNLDWRL